MKRFAFRLDKVLRIKQLRERLATAKVQQARLAWEAATYRVHDLHRQLADAASGAEAAVGRDGDGAAWADRSNHAAALGRTLEAAQAEVARRMRAMEESIAAHAQAAKEVEVLLTMRRQLWHEHRQELLHQQQERIDEHGLRGWLSNQD